MPRALSVSSLNHVLTTHIVVVITSYYANKDINELAFMLLHNDFLNQHV